MYIGGGGGYDDNTGQLGGRDCEHSPRSQAVITHLSDAVLYAAVMMGNVVSLRTKIFFLLHSSTASDFPRTKALSPPT